LQAQKISIPRNKNFNFSRMSAIDSTSTTYSSILA
jgi:hypothetical protein